MIGYLYTYGDNLSEEEAMTNFLCFSRESKYVVIGFCLMLACAKSASAIEVAVPKGNATVPGGSDIVAFPSPTPPKGVGSFAPVVAIDKSNFSPGFFNKTFLKFKELPKKEEVQESLSVQAKKKYEDHGFIEVKGTEILGILKLSLKN